MTTSSAPPTVAVWHARTNALRKGLRTLLQVIIALAPPLTLLLTGVLDPAQAASLSLMLTPVVAFAQNLLEDKGIIGTWLRRPTPSDTASVVLSLPVSPSNLIGATLVPGPPSPDTLEATVVSEPDEHPEYEAAFRHLLRDGEAALSDQERTILGKPTRDG